METRNEKQSDSTGKVKQKQEQTIKDFETRLLARQLLCKELLAQEWVKTAWKEKMDAEVRMGEGCTVGF